LLQSTYLQHRSISRCSARQPSNETPPALPNHTP
jgi:hypothetical protein